MRREFLLLLAPFSPLLGRALREVRRIRRTALVAAIFAAGAGAPTAFASGDSADELARLRGQLETARLAIAAQQSALEALQVRMDALQRAQPPADTDLREADQDLSQGEPAGPSKRFYGLVKLDASYDSAATDSGNLAMWVKPRGSRGRDDEFNITAKQSRLGVVLDGYRLKDFSGAARIETDFYGSASENGANPRLRLAYVTLRNRQWELLAGQDWDASNLALPATLNFATLGNGGALWSRRPQLRLTRFDEGADGVFATTFGIARTIGNDLDGGGQEDGKDSPMPTLQAKVSYDGIVGNRAASLGIAGHYGTEHADFQAEDDARFETRSISLKASRELSDRMTLTAVVWQGSNLSNYQGGVGQGINVFAMEEIDARGGWAQLSCALGERLKTYFTYGIDDPRDADLETGARSSNKVSSVGAFVSLSEYLTWAAELSYMQTGYVGAPAANNARAQSSIIFSF